MKKKKTKKVIARRDRVRELITHIGLIPKVIHLRLFLIMVPCSPVDVNERCLGVLVCFCDDQNRNGRKCGVKVVCIHFFDNL